MKIYKLDAIVLKSRDMREADKILTVYSIQRGKQRIVAHGAAKPNSRKRGAVQPFCFSEFMLHRGREIDAISQAELKEGFAEIRYDLDRLTAAAYITELLDGFVAEGEPNQNLFSLLYSALHLIAVGNSEMILRGFEAKLLGFSGLQPDLTNCSVCGAEIRETKVSFAVQQGGILCKDCATHEKRILKFSRGTVEVLKTLYRWELTKLQQLKVSEPLKTELSALLRSYIEYYLEKKLKTTEFMDRLYKSNLGRGTNI
ncbi:DNA replication and repair protein RecO [Desulforamulus reducens MI-1]|uniref:DNA repair protein RecO n=1 Tax=Desulforamulus reducens (strain ATCC BAA-1160 / DSM 100696 / MI-1) TaxID=349161 RepID=RECO_DESRM|nr:DNA repair protein RecO [Desulforamulus reducens]A4J7D2.1 RecName: Full=DNA repair protein RecO; AltName: Full=Recombination protein O [Desulforamulus reducens MI-1]ABO50985.1 DNA replication and repair protein RecO [Desulforamulus reducens MI-1]